MRPITIIAPSQSPPAHVSPALPPAVTVPAPLAGSAKVVRVRLRTALRHGLHLHIVCSAACSAHSTATIGGRDARRLGYRTTLKRVVVGRAGQGAGTAGSLFAIVVHFDRKARARLRHAGHIAIQLRTVLGAAGSPRKVITTTVTLRR